MSVPDHRDFVIIVRKPGEKRGKLLTPKAGCTRLRVHAARFSDRASAEAMMAEIEESNPGVTCTMGGSR